MKPIALFAIVSLSLTTPLAAQPGIGREVERLARARAYWPNFDPLAIPLATYDGKSTWLFRHPNPPPDFQGSPISSIRSDIRDGRHPAVTANSSAEIGGVMTATLLVDGRSPTRTPTELAATAIHESFHVFQRQHHPHWQANEGDLLLYPVDDAKLLALRRLESEALRLALVTRDTARAACLGRLAIDYRTRRFAAMDSAFIAYERGTELNEGLATYVQLLALGRTTVDIPVQEFAAQEVRLRSYTIGPAIAFLLDRIRPRWQYSLEVHDRQKLDEVLAGSLVGAVESPNGGCALSASRVAEIEGTAARDAANVVAQRAERRKAFEARPGSRVVITAAQGQPLWPKGFDPLNVERVDGGLLHTRFLTVGNESCTVTAIDEGGVDIDALTEGFGPHPLFNGMRRLVIAGLATPAVATTHDRVRIATPGLQLDCPREVVTITP